MIKKCLFPAAGYGTRFLPATKAMPKEMLTIVDRPVIQVPVGEDLIHAPTGAVMYQFGHGKDSITVHLGYGRTRCGHVGRARRK